MSHTDGGGRSTRSARESGGDMKGALTPPKKGSPPPLAWLIIGLLLVLGAIAFLTTRGEREPVRPGPSMPTAAGDESNSLVEPAAVPPPAPAEAPDVGTVGPATPAQQP